MKQLFTTIILTVFTKLLWAQINIPDELEQRLSGKSKFYEVQRTVEAYYKEQISHMRAGDSLLKKQANRQRKMWNRQFYWASSHLDANGEVVNAQQAIWNAVRQENTMARSAFGEWVPVGPDFVGDGIGRVNRIAFHPTDANTVFIGTPHGGLWKTTDGGNNWTCISGFIPSLGISGIIVDKINPDIIFVLTGDGDGNSGGFTDSYGYIGYSSGVLKTTDGGITWQQAGVFPVDPIRPRYTAYNMAQSPVNSNVLLAATSRGLFKTTDAGNTWTMCDLQDDGPSDDTARVYDVAFKPGDGNTIYCTIRNNGGSRFIRSVDGGSNFLYSTTVNFSPNTFNTGAQRIKIAVTTANANVVYLLAGPANETAQTFHGIWRSTDNGVNFTRMSSTPDILGYSDIINTFGNQNTYDLALAASPSGSNTIITGGLVVWRSTDGGTSLSEVVDYFVDGDNSNYIHSDVHDLQYNPLDGKLWAATDGGIAKSSNDGDSWTRVFNGLQISAFYHFEVSNENDHRWGGTQDCGTLEQSSGNTYSHFDGGDGYDVMTDKAPAGNNNDSYWVINKEIWTDGVADINITPDGTNEFFPLLGMKADDEDVLFAGYSRLYISTDRGDNWDSVYLSLPGYYIPANWAIATCASVSDKIYCAGITSDGMNSGIYKVTGLNSTPVATDISYGINVQTRQKITGIAVNPSNSNDVYITIGGFENAYKVFHTTNAGVNWDNITGSLPNLPVNCVLYFNDVVYIGTDIGVYVRDAGSTDWTPFYNGLPRVPVTEMQHVVRGGTDYIELSTFGRGLWQSEVYEPCSGVLQVDAALQGQQFYQAGAVINSTSVISGGRGTNVHFQAGSYIYLTPGFNAVSGTDFNAYLAPCNSGVPVRPAVTVPAKPVTTAPVKNR